MWRRINELMCGFADSLSRYLMAVQQWKISEEAETLND